MAEALAVGIDLGGTRTKLALVGAESGVRAQGVADTRVGAGATTIVAGALAAARQLIDQAGVEPQSVAAVGVGVAGLLDSTTGVVATAPNLADFVGLSITDCVAVGLDDALGVQRPIIADNDATAAAFAEARMGAGVGAALLVGVTLGTGVGGGLVVGGQPLRGARGMAGEIGHMELVPGGRACGCGRRGCLEPYVNAQALTAGALELGEPAVRARFGAAGPSARAVGEAAAVGEPWATTVLSQVGERLGQGLARAVCLLNPDRIVVGGGVALAGAPLFDAARRTLAAGTFEPLATHVQLVSAKLLDSAGAIGAALLALEHSCAG